MATEEETNEVNVCMILLDDLLKKNGISDNIAIAAIECYQLIIFEYSVRAGILDKNQAEKMMTTAYEAKLKILKDLP